MSTSLLIKNMVCPRCIEAVSEIFSGENLEAKVELGKVRLEKSISEAQKEKLAQLLQNRGFELLESGKSALISQIKTGIIDLVHHQDNQLQKNLSSYLSQKLNQEYSGLSKLFSQVEGITIERYYTLQKIEKVKEFLFYDELSLSEIAFKMGYSSVAYLSAQFKKETGMTPSEFKKNGQVKRKSLDGI
ncbi:helix-turn-helix domain-containing protein [Algoriphagus taiwanensis]